MSLHPQGRQPGSRRWCRSRANAQDAIIGYLLIGTELKAGALQSAIFNSANFSSIATDAEGRHSDLQRRRRAAGTNDFEHARVGDGGGVTIALQLELAAVDAARNIGGQRSSRSHFPAAAAVPRSAAIAAKIK